MLELISMGTNDFQNDNYSPNDLRAVIKNSKAHGRTPVVIQPNKTNNKIYHIAIMVEEVAMQEGVLLEVPEAWAKDGIHPKSYSNLAKKYDGAIVRGDSFAVGIISQQKNKNSLSWGKVGANSKTIWNKIQEIDKVEEVKETGMDKKKFYDTIRKSVNLTTQNVLGMDTVLDYLQMNESNLQHAAYILATAWWETGQTMMPVREAFWKTEDWRKKNFRYYPYYGRGYVQLTWEANYKKASDVFGVNFVKNPDWVMQVQYALPILVVGMNEGWFTGKDLDDYIDTVDENDSAELQEYKNARRIVNGTDKAQTIANLALVFEKGLKAGGYTYKKPVNTPTKLVQMIPDASGTKTPETKQHRFLTLLGLLFGKGK